MSCLACSSPFTELPYASGTYCAKCDTTCITCSGSSINSCSSCPTDFTLNANTSTCTAPSSSQITTVASVYHTYGFEMETSWWSGGSAWSGCGTITVLQTTGTTVISATHSLSIHYKVRIMMSLWWFGGTSHTLSVQLATTTGGNLITKTQGPTGTAGLIAGASYDPYCANSQAANFDQEYADATRAVKVNVFSTAAGANWGLREYVLITYNCFQPDCASCVGPLATECITCSDTNKKMYATTSGSCLCKF